MDEDTKNKNAAMAVKTASKLHAGIGDTPLFGRNTGRKGGYNAAGTSIKVEIAGDLMATLTEDKKATVADNEGWAGKRYTRTMPASEGTYEAVVYSNVEAPKMGKKFGSAAVSHSSTSAFQVPADRRSAPIHYHLTRQT